MSRPANLFPGPFIEDRDDIANLEKIKKPGILETLSNVGSAGVSKYMNAGIFPIAGQEPLSELQRKAEAYEYAKLLEKAVSKPKGSLERLLLVTAFNISGWTGSALRINFKAIRPMDFETFDYVSEDLGFNFLIENVQRYEDNLYRATSQAYGRGWSMSSEACVSIKWAMTAIDYNGNYAAEIVFDDGDTYILSMPPGYASGMASGNPAFTYNGKAVVEHMANHCSTEVDLTEPGLLSAGKKHKAKGYLVKKGVKSDELKISGTWDNKIDVTWQDGREENLWIYKDTSQETKNMYKMTKLAVQLNNLEPKLTAVLPPTDSRRRPDLRALERGTFEEADTERDRLLRLNKEFQAMGGGKARWFSLRETPLKAGPNGTVMMYKYDGGYWEARAAAEKKGLKAWKGCRNIVGPAE